MKKSTHNLRRIMLRLYVPKAGRFGLFDVKKIEILYTLLTYLFVNLKSTN